MENRLQLIPSFFRNIFMGSRQAAGDVANAASEMIGAAGRIVRRTYTAIVHITQRRDVGTPDYAFWDQAVNGKARGLEISGPMLKVLESKLASWVMGSAPTFTLANQVAQRDLMRWWKRNHPKILKAYQRAERYGDNFLIVNADLSLTAVPPSCMTPIVDDRDYSKLIGWRVTQEFPHPTETAKKMKVVDEYTARERMRTVTFDSGKPQTTRFRNVIGRVPVIHIPCNRGDDELFGRPIGEPQLPMLYEYNDVIRAGLDGNKRQGRPTPVVSKLGTAEQVSAFFDRITQRETKDDGTVTEHIEWDADQLMGLPGDADFKYASPAMFAGDTEKLLGLLFYLFLQSSETPEFIMGNAISSSKASAETQLPVFIQYIEKKRGEAEEWILELAEVVLAMIGAVDMTVRRDQSDDLEIEWDDLTNEDGELTIKAIEAAYKAGWITRETALGRMPALKVKDPAAEIKAADKENEELQLREDERMESAVDRAIRDAEARAAQLDEEEAETEEEEEKERVA
jgi:hypothetical protein